MKSHQPSYKNDFRNIREVLETISKGISDIKKMLELTNKFTYGVHSGVSEKKDSNVYPWHLPNVTTSADYESED